MRHLILAIAALSALRPATAQSPPSGFEAVELARSRTCVGVLDRLDALDQRLQPLAQRSQRLLGIAEAVALEESSVVGALQESDPVEAAVKAWFQADSVLARRYVVEEDPAVLEERTAGREAIKQTVADALEAVQSEADSIIASTGTLQSEAANCNGAIFVRSAVLEACASQDGALCEAARDTTSQPAAYRFVESADMLWDIQQLRPWTAPTPLTATPDGQLGGARTVGYTRTGNIVVNVAFYPMLRERSELTPEQLGEIQTVLDSLGFQASHPEIVFVPTLAVQASLPEALDDESVYILHFGQPDSADVVWTGPADTGGPLQSAVELGASEVRRLQAGDPLTLTALRQNQDGSNEAVFAIALTSVSQAARVDALVRYMELQLSGDLERLIPSGNGG